jgi:hypothetical protein
MGFLRNGQPLRAGKGFTDEAGNQYPTNWATVFTQDQKAALGITWEPDPVPVDTRFYWDHNLPKRLEDEPAVDENGDPVLDDNGVQIINTGLKTQWVATQKEIAGTLLYSSDWYVTRKVDTGIEVPATVKQYRDNIRLTCGLREDQITQCTTTEELAALLTNPEMVYDQATDSMVPNTEPFITPWPKNGGAS